MDNITKDDLFYDAIYHKFNKGALYVLKKGVSDLII